jgi:hypothetical protein
MLRLFRFLGLLFAVVAVLVGLHIGHASAASLNPDPGPNVPPSNRFLLDWCIQRGGGFFTNQQPDIEVWVGARNPQGVIDVTVPAGTTSYPLQYSFAGTPCVRNNGTIDVRDWVQNYSADNGAQVRNFASQSIPLDLPFQNASFPGCYQTVGCYLHDFRTFDVVKPGGFTTGDYTIKVQSKIVNRFADGAYECVGRGPGGADYIAGFNQYNLCGISTGTFTIHVTVQPKPKPNQVPIGSLAPKCVNGIETIVASFNDQDGNTVAEIHQASDNKLVSKVLAQSDSGKTPTDVSSYTGFASDTFNLYVRDVQPGGAAGSGSGVLVDSVNAGPCGGALTCKGASATPSIVEPGSPFTITANYSYSGGAPPSLSGQSITVTGPNGYNSSWSGMTPQVYPVTTSQGTITLTTPSISVPQAGNYLINWKLTAGAVNGNCAGTATSAPPVVCDNTCGVFQSYLKPYLQIYGGDISVGGGIPTVPASAGGTVVCTDQNAAASIVSWNTENAPWSGAGGEYGVHAPKYIFDFASNYGITSGTGRPTSLSFANTTNVQPTNGNYGGQSGASPVNSCDPTVVSGANVAGATVYNGNNKLSTLVASIPQPITGSHTIYVKGNVLIDQDITYAGADAGYGLVKDIPNFKLIVLGGDINISSSVGQLDGEYYAVPSASTGGYIYTCSNAAVVNPYGKTAAFTGSDNYSSCGKQLVVNGALSAKQIWFLRSCGTLDQSGSETVSPSFTSGGAGNTTTCSSVNHAAEVINFEPEEWMPVVSGPRGSGAYQSVQNLPPVL